MKAFRQKIMHHDPENGIYGDCTRTAYASILEMEPEMVPHFFHDGCSGGEGAKRIEAFLAQIGLHRMILATEQKPAEFLEYMGRMNPDLYWVMGCSSPTADHSVVCLGGKVVHDPARETPGEYGKTESGWTWAEILIPISTVAESGRVVRTTEGAAETEGGPIDAN